MADHSKPVTTDTYALYTQYIRDRIDDAVRWLDPGTTTPTVIPTDSKRWSSTDSTFQKWDGTAWVDLSATYKFTTVQVSGNLTFTGTGSRITGDFSNATIASRLHFQTTTVNGGTAIGLIPNGTSRSTQLNLETDPNVTNGVSFQFIAAELSGEGRLQLGVRGTGTYLPMTFYTGGAEAMRIDANRRLGLGVTPSAWIGSIRAFDFGTSGALYAVDDSNFINNAYIDSGSSWRYKNPSALGASFYNQYNGSHSWHTAPPGAAGAAITFTQAMTLNASSVFTVGGTSTAPAFKVNPTASQVNWPAATGAATGNPALLSAEGETDVGLRLASKGTGVVDFYTNTTDKQVEISHTASANRYITLTGSNGGAPYIGTSAGELGLGAAGATKFLVGTAGQWGVAGANYGTVGQSQFSGGPSAAPSWSSLANVGGAFTAYLLTTQTSGTTAIFSTATSSISCYDTSTGVFTAQATGWYSFSTSLEIYSNGAFTAIAAIIVNSLTVAVGTTEKASTGTADASTSVVVYMTAGQTAYVSSGSPYAASTYELRGDLYTRFSGCYLGA